MAYQTQHNNTTDTKWRVDLQSVLHETNMLSISAGDTGAPLLSGASCKKYKKKKDLDDRKRQEDNRTTQQSVQDSDDEKLGKQRSQKRRKSKKMMVVEVERIQRHLLESESYHADAEMGLNQDLADSDVEPVFENMVDVEMCPSGEASCTDDSSPSESRYKNDACDGDDELSDVESSKSLNDYPPRGATLNLKKHAPLKHTQSISSIMETDTWSHSKANKCPGLVARSIRNRANNRRRQRVKTIPSYDPNVPSDEGPDPNDLDHLLSIPHIFTKKVETLREQVSLKLENNNSMANS